MDCLVDFLIICDGSWVTEHVLASMFFLEFIARGAYVCFGCTYRKEAKSESTLAAILGKSSGYHALLNFRFTVYSRNHVIFGIYDVRNYYDNVLPYHGKTLENRTGGHFTYILHTFHIHFTCQFPTFNKMYA